MKKVLITIVYMVLAIPAIFSQEIDEKLRFHLAPESVIVYGSESETKGFTLIDEFEDNYSFKLTNKLYKVNLFFDLGKKETLRHVITKILDTIDSSENPKQLIWKKTNVKRKPVYTIELAERKIKIRLYRKRMDTETYGIINQLGKRILEEIND